MTSAVPTLAVLRRARALVEREETWTRGCAARAANGMPVFSRSPLAVRFCVLGAVRREAVLACGGEWPRGLDELEGALDVLAKRRGYPDHLSANDVGGRLVALAVIDDAIAELEGAGR